tara:strand:- start:5174 stop:5587 length:414 start_codon:yes stop_codon:yes gene_type:complete
MKRRSSRLKGGGDVSASVPSGDKLSFGANPGDTGKKLLENPHTTMALMICIIVFVSMWAIYSLSPDEDTTEHTKSFMLYEISMSVMSMTAAASGFAFFLLQGETESNSTVWGFPIIAGLSFLSWAYFAYGAYNAKQA